MYAVSFFLFYIFCRPLSLLPARVLYFFSDIMFLILRYIVRYRYKVVCKNLRESFPEKSEKEIRQIAQRFYQYLADVFIEYIILMGISIKRLSRRMQYKNVDYIKELHAKEKDVIIVLGHYGNWEWPSGFSTYTPFGLSSVYKKLRNPYFDRYFIKLRSRFGCEMVEMTDSFRYTYARSRKGVRTALALIADQSPQWGEMKYFTTFLNHSGTPVLLGPERIARALDMAVVFADIVRIKRGYYELTFVPLFEEVKDLPPYAITEAHVRMLEKRIQEQPEFWLWSHKRWKRMEKDMEEFMLKKKQEQQEKKR